MRRLGVVAAMLFGLPALAGCGAVGVEEAAAPAPAAITDDATATAPAATAPAPAAPTASPSPPPAEVPPPQPTTSAPPATTIPQVKVPPQLTGEVLGSDVSWPQCPPGMGIPKKQGLGLPMPPPEAEFVVLGLTNGPGFTPNPCLNTQVQWVKDRALMAAAYSVLSYPDDATLAEYGAQGPYDGSTRSGALSNVGYQQARFNLATMKAAALSSPIVWLDVEPVPHFEWSKDTVANAAVVIGAVKGYQNAGFGIGMYSTKYMWNEIVGDLHFNAPEWRPAGQTSKAEARRRCGPERMFQGGAGVIAQWVDGNRDLNVTCPGTEAELYRWFHQY